MESKYYTPKIEEFHVGFEFESFVDRFKEWKFNKVGKYELNAIAASVNCNLSDYYRVKYLDSRDIESFGFRLKVKTKFGITFTNPLYSIIVSKMKPNHVEIYLTNPYINESDGLKFSGIIKNKSELKKLLIQLEIINE